MMECNLLETYLNTGLTEEQTDAYRKHLASCSDCRDRVQHWYAFETRLRKWAAMEPVREALPAEAYNLMRRASAARKPEGKKSLVIGLAAAFAVSAAAASLLAILYNPSIPPANQEAPSYALRIAAPGNAEIEKFINPNQAVEAPPESHIVASIQNDKVGLSPKTRIRVLRADKDKTRLSLEQGTVACKVAKRNNGGEFVVDAGDLTVKVVGTKFSVTREASGKCAVVVEEGTVIVRDKTGRELTMRANDRVETDANGRASNVERADAKSLEMTNALLNSDTAIVFEHTPPGAESPASFAISDAEGSAPSIPAPSDVTARAGVDTEALTVDSFNLDTDSSQKQAPPLRMWQNWIMGGRVNDAAQAMRKFVKDNPEEPSVWALLADCERKEGNFRAAVRAYEKVMLLGNAKQRARAAYMAASVLQSQLGDHRRALKLFQSYKESSHAAPELIHLADVNIIRSLAALGRCSEAEAARNHIQKQGGSVISSNINQLVENCRTGN
jgi:ferric-dicitrate binding protein FerR (iron transport regulator)